MLNNTIEDEKLKSIGSNLWKEDLSCIEWLDTKEPNSVVYVNFGSIIVMNFDQFMEMAWGLANSKKQFLWIIRPDLIAGDSQGHISPMLKLAKLVHHNGFYVTFVNTEFNHKRLLRSNGPHSLDGLPDFRFETIPDGLPPADDDATQHIPSLCESTSKNCSAPFRGLINKINAEIEGVPPVTCIASDGVMSFTLEVAEEFGLPEVLFWTPSACGFMCYLHYRQLVDRGYTPLKDESQITNGYLETIVDWVPGMLKDMRLEDFPSFIRTTDPNDIMLNFFIAETERISKASAIILNTFDAFEHNVLNALITTHPHIYTIGPLQLMLNTIDEKLKSISSNLWKEDLSCIEWLDTKEPNSVVYVNFGSIAVMNFDQFTEMAWGLANSKKKFLWIIRPDLITGDSVNLPEDFLSEIKDRGMIANWCPQEEVLKHGAIGGFLTHSGWNSTLNSVCAGVPVLCWPFFAEQQTNCRYSCIEWEMGMEINDLKRSKVEILVRELMDGEKGKKMKLKAMNWKEEAEKAAGPGGSSCINVNKLFNEVLFPPAGK
ncbi:UDP-glycosyltransferase 85A8-like [Solanum dulcamara]|uniref:UDP-glycosyltransferase 85A8-like n=1 Tax=Solanum dulcamara TaxID=45834 RepID=UPI0024850A29|nr:UDP-glycosyltransferase 85A8-like [Solanum dulcamara]